MNNVNLFDHKIIAEVGKAFSITMMDENEILMKMLVKKTPIKEWKWHRKRNCAIIDEWNIEIEELEI